MRPYYNCKRMGIPIDYRGELICTPNAIYFMLVAEHGHISQHVGYSQVPFPLLPH